MEAIVILVGGKGSRVKSLLRKIKTRNRNNFKKKIIDFQLEKLSKLNKKIFFLSNIKYKNLKKYISDNYKKNQF